MGLKSELCGDQLMCENDSSCSLTPHAPLFQRKLALPFKTAIFEPQYLSHFETYLNTISQVYYNGSPTSDFSIAPSLCYGSLKNEHKT